MSNFTTCRKSVAGNIITPKSRMSFPILDEPTYDMGKDSGKKKYRLSLIIKSGNDISLLKEEATRVAKEHFGDKVPGNLKTPFLKGEDQKMDGCEAGDTILRVTTLNKPGVVNAKGENVDPASSGEVYGGRWCVASLRPYVYETKDPKTNAVINRGVSFGLQNVQLLDHDTPFGRGKANAEDEFAPVEAAGGAKPASADELF